MTIGELSAASGLPASTIRYWEKIGVLPKPIRAGGQRRYSADDVQRLGWPACNSLQAELFGVPAYVHLFSRGSVHTLVGNRPHPGTQLRIQIVEASRLATL